MIPPIDWKKLPYDHAGTWYKNQNSIMTQGQKITWPQLICEMIVYNRKRFWQLYKDVPIGPDWYKAIPKHVRELVQQAYNLSNYFPHPNQEPLVIVAFKNVFRNFGTTKIGQFRRARLKKNGSSNITQDEKDVVTAVWQELNRLIKQRDAFKDAAMLMQAKKIEVPKDPTFSTATGKRTKKISAKEILNS